MGHSSVRGLRRLEWGHGDGDLRIGRSGVSSSQVLEGCRRGLLDVDGDVRDDGAMAVATVVGKDVLLLSFRPRASACLGDCGGVMRATGVAVEPVVAKADALDDALDRAGESVGVRNDTVGFGRGIGVVLRTGAGRVNGRYRCAGKGEGGGVGRLPLAEVDTAEFEASLVALGRRARLEVV